MSVLDTKVLVLNRVYFAIGVTTVREAFKLIYEDVAHVLDKEWGVFDFKTWSELEVTDENESVGLVKGRIRVPRVIRLREYNKIPNRIVKFSRVNVLLRDSFTCQYCNEKKNINKLNMDHVIPRAQGGQTTWENIVTSCVECNTAKADRTPEQAGFSLTREPFRPNWTHIQLLSHKGLIYPEWEPFLKVYMKSGQSLEMVQ